MSGEDADPVVGLAAPRPDFDGALREFLIGLFTAALRPQDESQWNAQWYAPPTVEELQTTIDALPEAFDLDGDGPRFFQDLGADDFADAEAKPIDQLLIDSPGDQGISLNKDLFVKRARVATLSRPAAAMALLTMQTYAPAGGQGYRTSMRGGGPLTTLVDPRLDQTPSRAQAQPVWQMLWANVETTEQLANRTPYGDSDDAASIFPWLAPTRASHPKKGGASTTPEHGNPLQAYFGLPRRIRLEFGDPGSCDLTGVADDHPVVGFRAINYGVQYDGWQHPLSPAYRTKLSEPWLPVHGQPGGVAWRDWLSLTLDAPTSALRRPAFVIAAFGSRRARSVGRREYRVRVAGYDMDNMKARGWIESILPAFSAEDERRALLYSTARHLVEATSIAASALLMAVKSALFQSPEDAPGNLDQVKIELWAQTEGAFYAAMRSLADEAIDQDGAVDRAEDVRRGFAPVIERAATTVFDGWCPVGGLDVDALRRRVAARYQLTSALRGFSKLGESIFQELALALPGGGRAARASKKAAKKSSRTKETS
jgi:CRISPR system Cascade subunit CasA